MKWKIVKANNMSSNMSLSKGPRIYVFNTEDFSYIENCIEYCD